MGMETQDTTNAIRRIVMIRSIHSHPRQGYSIGPDCEDVRESVQIDHVRIRLSALPFSRAPWVPDGALTTNAECVTVTWGKRASSSSPAAVVVPWSNVLGVDLITSHHAPPKIRMEVIDNCASFLVCPAVIEVQLSWAELELSRLMSHVARAHGGGIPSVAEWTPYLELLPSSCARMGRERRQFLNHVLEIITIALALWTFLGAIKSVSVAFPEWTEFLNDVGDWIGHVLGPVALRLGATAASISAFTVSLFLPILRPVSQLASFLERCPSRFRCDALRVMCFRVSDLAMRVAGRLSTPTQLILRVVQGCWTRWSGMLHRLWSIIPTARPTVLGHAARAANPIIAVIRDKYGRIVELQPLASDDGGVRQRRRVNSEVGETGLKSE